MKKMKSIIFLLVITIIISCILPSISYGENTVNNEQLGVTYRTHVQDIGWQGYVKDGTQAGTTGKNLKVEAMNISLENKQSNINIKYTTYIQNYGWQKTVSNGEQTGTTGKNLRMEAIKIWLEGTSDYSVMYRTHIQDYGWQEWVYDGEISGNLGDNKKIEAIEIKIVPKQNAKVAVSYNSHVQDLGWENEIQEYNISGTTGKNKKVEAIKINLKNAPEGMNIKYKTYVEKSGWQQWVENGQVSGTTGKNQRLYGIRIMLEGTKEYSIQYRVHVQDVGWMNWVKNGEIAGKISHNKKIEAIQIRILEEANNTDDLLGVEYYTYLNGSSSNENKMERNGEISGTTGQNRKVEGIGIELINAPEGAHIKYRAHVQDIGWMDWMRDGQVAGVLDKNLKIEAIQIQLEGLDEYTVEYKAHVQDIGWTEWYIDGEVAGTTGKNKKIEAIQIRITDKYQRYYKGIDVSRWQGEINFDKLVASKQVDFMISRIGWYSETQSKFVVDAQFERNYKNAKAKKLPIGAYVYSYATSIEGAKKEAEEVVKYLKETNQTDYELPIFYDLEDDSQRYLGKQTLSKMAIAFGEVLQQAGYKVGLYSYAYWLDNFMDLSMIPQDYALWIANYEGNTTGELPENIYKYAKTHDLWQYTDSGKVDGIQGNVDMNICYKRYF